LRENKAQIESRTHGLLRARREFEHLQAVYRRTNDALQSEQNSLNESQSILRRQIDGIRNNRRLLEMQRQQGERALDAIQDMVKIAARGIPISGTPLNLIKGKLPWPIGGKIVEKFGKSRNEELNTVTDNPGIELSCKAGDVVQSVAPGIVSSVTWLRGFGNVCIVEHPGSFYTVYAKLGEVKVQPNDMVSDKSVLGYPSLDPMNNEYRFHFELWDRREKQDPLTWLEKR
jgi:septal ring factor EnvC (AmiA/AmiB activator)